MQDLNAMLAQLKRPGLLVKAARMAAEDYQRDRHLPGLIGGPAPRRHGAAALDLMGREAELEQLRREGATTYSSLRHVRLLSALIAEARLMATTTGLPEA
ncbi:DUF6477 family protein [Oceanicola sp. S124]|uniref:DUF6477 family protein n=1 Tax=Oceanicola sp. S124 TaxID=1042378 RepID=UPI00025579AA|nr:DUF6477 family protein [Oceanicola sp. S124]